MSSPDQRFRKKDNKEPQKIVWTDLPFSDGEESELFKIILGKLTRTFSKEFFPLFSDGQVLVFPWFFSIYKYERYLKMVGEHWILPLFKFGCEKNAFSEEESYERIMMFFEYFTWQYVDGEKLLDLLSDNKALPGIISEELEDAFDSFLLGEKSILRDLVFEPEKGIQYFQTLLKAKDYSKKIKQTPENDKEWYFQRLSLFVAKIHDYAEKGLKLFQGLHEDLKGYYTDQKIEATDDLSRFEKHHRFLKSDWLQYFKDILGNIVVESFDREWKEDNPYIRLAVDAAATNCLLNHPTSSEYLSKLLEEGINMEKRLGLKDKTVCSAFASSRQIKEKIENLYPEIPVFLSPSRDSTFALFLVKENPTLSQIVRPAELWDRKNKMDPRIEELLNVSPIGQKLLEETAEKIKGQSQYEIRKMDPEKVYFVIGDIHGDKTTLLEMLFSIYQGRDPEQVILFFLGDYLDRGKKDIYVLSIVFSLFLAFPDNIVLLKGNHEKYAMNHGKIRPEFKPSHFFDEYYEDLEANGLAQLFFIDLLGSLKVFAVLENDLRSEKTLLAHAGIPDKIYLQNVQTLEETLSQNSLFQEQNHLRYSAESNFLWRDPSDLYFDDGTARYVFTLSDFLILMQKFGISRMIRSHEYDPSTKERGSRGYRVHFEKYPGSVITIFSTGGKSPDTYYTDVSEPSFAQVVNDGTVKIHTITDEREE
ncbi:MAG: serine/threonine protein phosphatase [Thermotogae bacterium]|nr:serine/threonine protein phosphatase [Thermotogota bacterium]